ncbi:MAG: tetratricopeptide repeat protein, partial [Candidatus Eisenbacteria bacterium]|nr:tetratricopeptide repeat protein [Candidatus Eisenbacteria bacterium]
MSNQTQIERVFDENGNDILNENDTCTVADIEESVKAFLLGDITLAQLEGVSAEDIYAVADMGYDLFEAGKIEEARKIFEGLNTYNPMDSYFHSVLGSIYQREERFEDAARHYKSAVELYPEDVSSWTNLGETMLRWCGKQSQAGEIEAAG